MKNSRRDFLTKAAASTALTLPFINYGKEYETAINKTPKLSSPSKLKITDTKCGYKRRKGLFVKIYSNQDIVGHGEGVDATPGTYHWLKDLERDLEVKASNIHRLEDIRRAGFFKDSIRYVYSRIDCR